SNLVWASIIGLILIYLTAGYFLGGAWADRSPKLITFFRVLAWGAFSTALIPLVSRPVLRLAANAFDNFQMGVLIGSFVAVMILFSIPVTLLGTASPFTIRLSIETKENAGKISGRIYAISTLGSFVGTFLPTLILIPTIGTYRTFLVLSGLLLLVALYGLWWAGKFKALWPYLWMPVVVIGLAILGVRGTDKTAAGQVYETESAYNYIQVLEQDGTTVLRLNEGQGDHSVYNPDVLNYQGPWEQVLVAPFFNSAPVEMDDIERIAIVGLAAGTTARQATAVYGDIPIDGYEIDPVIVEVGQEYFNMTETNLNVIIQDGRIGLAESSYRYDIISVDAYRPPYIPWQLTTVEFFQSAYDHLSDTGVLTLNVGRSPNDRRLINSLAATLLTIFPNVHVIDLPYSFNSIIFATVQPTDPQNLMDNYLLLTNQADVNPLLTQTMALTLTSMAPAPDIAGITPFTDDLAPIEWITNSLVLNFILSDGSEILQ
ncbi:MAG TPA: fused MFS/spermidine synthase, partial [Longilinea sp.]|nr:fused MFS/spermidine synthase [Longilinea sp.]